MSFFLVDVQMYNEKFNIDSEVIFKYLDEIRLPRLDGLVCLKGLSAFARMVLLWCGWSSRR